MHPMAAMLIIVLPPSKLVVELHAKHFSHCTIVPLTPLCVFLIKLYCECTVYHYSEWKNGLICHTRQLEKEELTKPQFTSSTAVLKPEPVGGSLSGLLACVQNRCQLLCYHHRGHAPIVAAIA
jgi:hypothetical protein